MTVTAACVPILDALKDGPRDTIEIMEATGIPYVALTGRLVRLREAGLIHGMGRRYKLRAKGVGYVMIWAMAKPVQAPPPSDDLRIAGRIVHGRGSKWGSGLV